MLFRFTISVLSIIDFVTFNESINSTSYLRALIRVKYLSIFGKNYIFKGVCNIPSQEYNKLIFKKAKIGLVLQ